MGICHLVEKKKNPSECAIWQISKGNLLYISLYILIVGKHLANLLGIFFFFCHMAIWQISKLGQHIPSECDVCFAKNTSHSLGMCFPNFDVCHICHMAKRKKFRANSPKAFLLSKCRGDCYVCRALFVLCGKNKFKMKRCTALCEERSGVQR